jgi:hypothetical protein
MRRGQPIPGIHRRIAGCAAQDASLTVIDGIEAAHRWPGMPGGVLIGRIEHDLGLELPADPEVLRGDDDVCGRRAARAVPARFWVTDIVMAAR